MNIQKLAKSLDNYVYHIKSSSFKGNHIYSLSELKEEYPQIYKSEIKKYKDREDHPEIKINILDCQWKDCVSFSSLNILKILELEKLLGVPGWNEVEDICVLRFSIDSFKDREMCIYDDNISPKKKEAYSKTSIKSYKEMKFIPDEMVKYYIKCKENKERPLLFGYVNHLMVKGKVSIKLGEEIYLKDLLECT